MQPSEIDLGASPNESFMPRNLFTSSFKYVSIVHCMQWVS